jgi:hypothetical protein
MLIPHSVATRRKQSHIHTSQERTYPALLLDVAAAAAADNAPSASAGGGAVAAAVTA